MVALPHRDTTPAVLAALARAAERSLGTRPGARLACVTVVAPGAVGEAAMERRSLPQELLKDLRAWVGGLARGAPAATCHVLEAGDVAQALLAYASANHVDLIVLGAATHGLQLQRLIVTVPIKVAMHAPCTVVLVKA
jgi:nucleotide-binding universal stress UspA family protein